MTKRVKGPTDHVVVVGAGLAGLSTALRLAGAGRKVTVIERESVPGGRNGLLNKDGYAFDTGPSVLTMPSLINDAFNSVGEELKDWLELTPVKPLYRAFYADGSQIDVHANTEEMEAEIARTISSSEAAGYRRYVASNHHRFRCARARRDSDYESNKYRHTSTRYHHNHSRSSSSFK